MRFVLVAVILSSVFPMASCANKEDEGRKPVPPPNTSSQIPWNKPRPGQGGGAFGALPTQPRR